MLVLISVKFVCSRVKSLEYLEKKKSLVRFQKENEKNLQECSHDRLLEKLAKTKDLTAAQRKLDIQLKQFHDLSPNINTAKTQLKEAHGKLQALRSKFEHKMANFEF